jgi:O2-independent ubiquinone biosynthesis protein UbiV
MTPMGDEGVALTLGPVFYNWVPERWRDFYFRIADEADVDTVCVGEVVCSKRQPLFESYVAEVVERLAAAGKEVVLSSLALVMDRRERQGVRALCAQDDFLVEANDISAVGLLSGRRHAIGPFVNVYNEGTLAALAVRGAVRVSLPGELPATSLRALAAAKLAELEVQVFGRLPLAVSARCYHARAHGRTKDSCQYICAEDPDGMMLADLDGQAFLAVNGTQTQSHACCNLLSELGTLRAMGVGRFRLSPQSTDMVAVAALVRAVAGGRTEPAAANESLTELLDGIPFSNGFFHGVEGWARLDAN